MYEHILISTDGSEVARKGVDHGLALAKAVSAKVTIVTVSEALWAFVGGDGGLSPSAYLEYTEAQRMRANDILAEAKADADRQGIAAEMLFLEDAMPAEAIIEAAGTHGCNLIVMASHGRRGVQRLLLGSVTAEVVGRSPVPVLVVR